MQNLDTKVVCLGTQGVGKTSIVMRYVGKMFSNNVNPTIGASFFTFRMNIENYRVQLQLWDTAGQERFRSMAPMYYRNANAALVVYDITEANSLDLAKDWVKELQQNVEHNIAMCLIGNKSDLDEHRQVTTEEGKEYADSINAIFVETSAKENTGVKEAFLQITQELIKRHKHKLTTMSPDSALSNPAKQGVISLDNRIGPGHLRQRGQGNGDTYITQIPGDMSQSARYDTPPGREKSCCSS
ncbi:Ras-related protein Rab-22A-like [Oopsacas minuta]|uniref:Ras-related protein Rab-22A-like n=1 Tax=Oopsacas minuta TaxID=111878 RepID=A0AAV7KAI7_9METZ|nr:Ras-related protein Rab-22A-like [Oopsacas minuta]